MNCPHCGQENVIPLHKKRLTTGGWVWVIVWALLFWPVALVAIAWLEDYLKCPYCLQEIQPVYQRKVAPTKEVSQ